MSENYVPNVGHLASEDSLRDAIHIPLAPVVAGERLEPGDHVSLTRDKYQHATKLNPTERIGIVDPFLTKPVEVGERFWLFLYPGTITGLRHMWNHPAFKVKIPSHLIA